MRENSLKIFCSNVRGIICNWDSVTAFDWNLYDIIGFTEIWRIQDFENLQVDGFEIKTVKLRKVSRGGGTIIFGKTGLKTEELETPFVEGIIETTGIKIGNINFIQIYRPPSGSKEDFVNYLTLYLNKFGGQKILLGGDLNLNTLVPNKWINDICNNFDLRVMIDKPTRLESGHCIDNFLSNIKGDYSVSTISIADHQAICAVLETSKIEKNKANNFLYREMKELNWLLFKNEIFNLQIYGIGIEDKWNNFLIDIKNIVETCFPQKLSKIKYKFAMSQGLIKSRDKKNELLRKYKAGKINKDVYVKYNKCYRKLIKSEQFNTFKYKMASANNNGKEKWKIIKNELLINSTNVNINEIMSNGLKLNNESDIAEAFKLHFETCAMNLAIGLPVGKNTCEVLPQGGTWSFAHTTEIDLIKLIKSLANKNSSGEDKLSNKMLKREPYLFAKLLKPLINESIDKGLFPNNLKSANIIPVFKKEKIKPK